jgi:hypothetical protein
VSLLVRYSLLKFAQSVPFGWEPDADGFRGHVFVSDDNSTVVISVKGTSAPWIAGGEGPTKKKDKLNDNLLFSCCCARVGPTWYTVCDCFAGGDKCDTNCVEQALVDDSLFYPIGTVRSMSFFSFDLSKPTQNLYNDVAYMYPDANIWLTGPPPRLNSVSKQLTRFCRPQPRRLPRCAPRRDLRRPRRRVRDPWGEDGRKAPPPPSSRT